MRQSLLLAGCVSLLLASVVFAVEPEAKPAADKDGWKSLFDGKSLDGWAQSKFAGGAEPRVEDGKIILPFGSDMTGITYTGKPERMNYELELDAMRVDGNDFFCGLTFPVGDDPCTLICGGWGGGLVGLSSMDGMDASENDTSSHYDFKSKQWYHIRLRVTKSKIEAWIDDKQIIDSVTTNRRISIRPEVEHSKPLGISTWCTTGAIKNIRVRSLDDKKKS